MVDLKLPFGLREGQLFHVSEVDGGLACDCFCPACGHPLIARKGAKVIHHFAHYNGSTCQHAVQTALHLAAKALLEKEKQIRLPPVELLVNYGNDPWIIHEEQIVSLGSITLEQKLDDIVPDVLVYVNNRALMIEIKVSHGVNADKLARIKKSGISVLEIDLSKFAGNPTLEELREQIVYSRSLKHWLYNKKLEAVKTQLFRLVDRKKLIHRGLALHVDNCPINARLWHGKSYANVFDDCSACEYNIHLEIQEGEDEHYLLCAGKRRIVTYQDYLKVNHASLD